MEWIYIIAIGFICVMYPILMILYTLMMPWYIIIAFFIWITVSLIILMKLETKIAITITVVLTIIYTYVFCKAIPYSNNAFLFNDNKALSYIMPAFCLPAIIYFGFKLKKTAEASKNNRLDQLRQSALSKIDSAISQKNITLEILHDIEKGYSSISHLLELIVLFDHDRGKATSTKYNAYLADSFSKTLPSIMNRVPATEKSGFPQNFSELKNYKSAIKSEQQELMRKKSIIQSSESLYEIRNLVKDL